MRLNKAKIVKIQLSQCHAPESKRQKKGGNGLGDGSGEAEASIACFPG